MELYHEIKEKAYVVILAGSLDGSNAQEIDFALKKAIKSRKDQILIDCRNLKYISSSSIGIFLANLPSIKHLGMDLVFYDMKPNIRKIFMALGLDSLVKISDTPEPV
jgi:anti-anti-sigma factor